MLWQPCAYALVTFRYKKYLVRVRRRSCFCIKYPVVSLQTRLENFLTSRMKPLLSESVFSDCHRYAAVLKHKNSQPWNGLLILLIICLVWLKKKTLSGQADKVKSLIFISLGSCLTQRHLTPLPSPPPPPCRHECQTNMQESKNSNILFDRLGVIHLC